LFDLHEFSEDKRYTQHKFKVKLQNLLAVEYSKPKEVLNKWVAGFYELRSKIVHGEEMPDPIFKGNPNIEVSYIRLGVKIFVVAFYYELIGNGWIEPNFGDDWLKRDFLVFFWPEIDLLESIKGVLVQLKQQKNFDKFPFLEILDLEKLEEWYVKIYGDVAKHPYIHGIKFIPSDKVRRKKLIDQLKYLFQEQLIIREKEIQIKKLSTGMVDNQSTTDRFLGLI
jgi:hypothetical protein